MIDFLWVIFLGAAAIQLIFNLLSILSLSLYKDNPRAR